MFRVRLTYTKSKEAIYIPEKDLSQVFAKALARAGIYTQYDKNDEPDIEFAESIMLGIESTCEICDICITEDIDLTYMIKGLNKELPLGIVVLTAEYLEDGQQPISKATYAVTYEIIPNLGDITKMTNREYEDRKRWYRFKMEDYLSEDAILVLVKNDDRSERIDIKPAIKDYEILINNALRITVLKNTEYIFSPYYIMDGFKEYTNEEIEYSVKRTKILH